MTLSIFDLFKIGIGPSSSHTVGPMVAARRFICEAGQFPEAIMEITVDLFGSLAMTGKGHNTDIAVILGLMGETPSEVDVSQVDFQIAQAREKKSIVLGNGQTIDFDPAAQLRFNQGASLTQHSNGMVFTARNETGSILHQQTYFSVGGGFVLSESEISQPQTEDSVIPPLPFDSGKQLLDIGSEKDLKIADIAMINERSIRTDDQIVEGIYQIWTVMKACIDRGCRTEGILPGVLGVKRRAPQLYKELQTREKPQGKDDLGLLDWVNLFAIAVNEENAAGGRVVTAPTNGAAGVIPAVLAYYLQFVAEKKSLDEQKKSITEFLLTAAAIGMLFKTNASISAAEVGCQGEIGVACSMAAAGLAAVLGGSNAQIENAAEIGMEHNLGLTCDPIAGLVQIPCIERNTMGAVKAINAAQLALQGDGLHHVSLDSVIETMHQTGKDMQDKYKETSMGGLAVNVVNC